MEDVRIGRKTRSILAPVIVTVAGNQVVNRNEKRTVLIISAPIGNTVTLLTEKIPALLSGYNLGNNGQPLKLNIQEHGDIVTQAWYGIADTNPMIVGVIEGFLDET